MPCSIALREQAFIPIREGHATRLIRMHFQEHLTRTFLFAKDNFSSFANAHKTSLDEYVPENVLVMHSLKSCSKPFANE